MAAVEFSESREEHRLANRDLNTGGGFEIRLSALGALPGSDELHQEARGPGCCHRRTRRQCQRLASSLWVALVMVIRNRLTRFDDAILRGRAVGFRAEESLGDIEADRWGLARPTLDVAEVATVSAQFG